MRETKIERMARLLGRLAEMGISYSEAQSLRRIEMTFQRWAEHECNGWIQRDERTGKPYRHYKLSTNGPFQTVEVADREAGALKRLAKIMSKHPELVAYHQGDCRGCMLYILRQSDIGAGERIDSVYTRGVAVCA